LILPVASLSNDVVAPLILAVVGGGVAAVWPWLQTYWRGVKFQGIIKRELEELAPFPPTPAPNTPWWEHLRKRFVHEEIFARNEISANRDFLLSLNPDVVYKVSQLWIAFEKRDAEQWLHFLKGVAHDDRVGSPKLRHAHKLWSDLLKNESSGTTAPRVRDTTGTQRDSLLEARLAAYALLFGLTRYGSEGQPLSLSDKERARCAERLMDWFYGEEGGGLLLSGEAFLALRRAHARLTDPTANDRERWRAFSALRTELKIDLGVRHADVRNVEMGAIT
jgi:hypothetical protein